MMIKAPEAFSGTLDDLYEQYVSKLLLSLDVVEEFHQSFRSFYLNDADPLYLVRYVSDLERGQTIRTADSSCLRGTDNSPAWWIHYQLFYGKQHQFVDFPAFLDAVPCHMFSVRLPEHVSMAGWHVAHIYEAKDRNQDYHHWDRAELLRRTARNIHPCNYFYIPKAGWRTYGGNQNVIRFFYNKFKVLYQPIWDDFLKLVNEQPLASETTFSSNIPYLLASKKENHLPSSSRSDTPGTENGSARVCKIEYHHQRLCFKADLIEPLDMDDYFRVNTGEGTFEMSKRDFYEVFANVASSQSYQTQRLYHYSVIPQKAARFKVI